MTVFNISLTPTRMDGSLRLSRSGNKLSINDETFDLSDIPDGATLPRSAVTCDWLASDIEKVGEVLYLTLISPHGADASSEALFPAPVTVTGDGPITLPPYEEFA